MFRRRKLVQQLAHQNYVICRKLGGTRQTASAVIDTAIRTAAAIHAIRRWPVHRKDCAGWIGYIGDQDRAIYSVGTVHLEVTLYDNQDQTIKCNDSFQSERYLYH